MSTTRYWIGFEDNLNSLAFLRKSMVFHWFFFFNNSDKKTLHTWVLNIKRPLTSLFDSKMVDLCQSITSCLVSTFIILQRSQKLTKFFIGIVPHKFADVEH